VTRAVGSDAPIQWYPGHMVKAMRRLEADVAAADAIVEVVDARVPYSGGNPTLAKLAGRRPRLLVLSREDLADPTLTNAWLERIRASGREALAIEGKTRGSGVHLREALLRIVPVATTRVMRAIVVGIPNAGKSTVINALVGRNVARVEDRAGVTRQAQWFRVTPALEVMDTAGILVPKIATPAAQWKLAVVGAVPRMRFDAEEVAAKFAVWAAERLPQAVPDLETFAHERGFVRRGNLADLHNASWAYLKDVGDGRFGRITLEIPHLDAEDA